MKTTLFVLLLTQSLFCWSQLSKDQVLKLLSEKSPESAAAAISASGFDFELDADFMAQLCAHPETLQLILARIVNANNTGQATHLRPIGAKEVTQDPKALVIQKIYELNNNLTVANRLETTPEVIDRRLGFRDFMVRTLMEPNHEITLSQIESRLGSEDFLLPWVKTLVNDSVKAKEENYPKVTFSADKSATLSLSSAERGIQGYLGLFMVKGDHTRQDFSLEDNLIYTHPELPMTYNTKKEIFEPGRLEKSRITTLNLGKIFKNFETFQLYPGTWGLRFRHTNGNHSLRSDRTVYFDVEPGKEYDMKFAWVNSSNGVGLMDMQLVEK